MPFHDFRLSSFVFSFFHIFGKRSPSECAIAGSVAAVETIGDGRSIETIGDGRSRMLPSMFSCGLDAGLAPHVGSLEEIA